MLMKAISIRQPFAWAILNGKPVENRGRAVSYRGPILLHASRTFDMDGYMWILENAQDLFEKDIDIPDPADFDTGGIVGKARLVDCVRSHPSPWFFGPWGLVLKNPEPLPFYPCKGQVTIPFEVDYAIK